MSKTLTYSIGGTKVHGGSPTISTDLTIKITRSSKQTKNVTIEITGTLSLKYSGSKYGSPYSSPKTGIYFSTRTDTNHRHGNYYNIKYDKDTDIDVSWTEEWTSGTLKIYSHCGFGGEGSTAIKCTQGYDDVELKSIDISKLPYEEYTQPTNFKSGKVYNHSGTQNGKEKPDGSFKVTWSGENAGSFTWVKTNIDIFKVSGHYTESNYRIGSYDSVSQNTLYYLDNISYNGDYSASLPRHIRPGDTLYVTIRGQYRDNNGNTHWLDRVFIGTLTIYKDGKILYKQSNGSGVECTKLYYKQSNGTVKKGRYAFYKQNNSTIKVIDMFTYCYE